MVDLTENDTPDGAIVDKKLPLTWLLGTGGTILVAIATLVWNIAISNKKMEDVLVSQAAIIARLDQRDTRQELRDAKQDDNLIQTNQAIYAMQRQQDKLAFQVEAQERARNYPLPTRK